MNDNMEHKSLRTPSLTILELFEGKRFKIPRYQRPYSWLTPKEGRTAVTQVDKFLSDFDEHTSNTSPYYLGHFLFEEIDEEAYDIVDGQQRLSTLVLLVASLVRHIEHQRDLTEEELRIKSSVLYDGMPKLTAYEGDAQFFTNYSQKKGNISLANLKSPAAVRIAEAVDYIDKILSKRSLEYCITLLNTVVTSYCTTHVVEEESQAIQLFLYQNDRGKNPTTLDVVKSRFMYHAHIYADGKMKEYVIQNIKDCFGDVYKSSMKIEHVVTEQRVLAYTCQVYFNKLTFDSALELIEKKLSESRDTVFIEEFCDELVASYQNLEHFLGKGQEEFLQIYSFTVLGIWHVAMPFVLKAYKFGLESEQIAELTEAFEKIALRHKLVKTRADFATRVSKEYKMFNSHENDVKPIISHLLSFKNRTDYWGGHWRDSFFEAALKSNISRSLAKYILWKYENYLCHKRMSGYKSRRYDDILNPELEHIAPSTEPPVRPHGYPDYDEQDFKRELLNCLGNWMILPKEKNASIGNAPFVDKLEAYNVLEQQRDVVNLSGESRQWTKEMISARRDLIVKFALDEL